MAPPFRYYSQHGEDALLMEFFGFKKSGLYIDVGAFDGVHLSNSLCFEQAGWRGLCVEPHPRYAPMCTANRPGATCIEAAICGDPSLDTIELNTEPLGLLSTNLPAGEARDDVRYRFERRGLEFEDFETVRVPARTLTQLLEEHIEPRKRIDFLSIDVEGFELEVLRGLDLTRFKPRVLIIECNSDAHRDAVAGALKEAGYRLARNLDVNAFFVRNRRDEQRLQDIELNCVIEKQCHPLGPDFTEPAYLEGLIISGTLPRTVADLTDLFVRQLQQVERESERAAVLQQNATDLRKRLESSRTQADAARKRVTELNDHVERARSQLADARAQLEAQQRNVADLKQREQARVANQAELTERISAFKGQIESLRESRERAVETVAARERKLAEQIERIDALNGALKERTEAVTHAQSRSQVLGERLADREQTLDAAQSRAGDLEAVVAERNASLASAQTRAEELAARLQDNRDKLAEQRSRHEATLTALRQETEATATRLTRTASQLAERNARVDALNAQLEGSRTEYQETRSRAESLRTDLELRTQQRDQKSQQLDTLFARLHARTRERDDAREQRKRASENLATTRTQLGKARGDLATTKGNLVATRDNLNAARARSQDLQQRLGSAQAQNRELREARTTLNQSLKQQRRELQSNEQQLQSTEGQLESTRQALDTTRTTLAETEAERQTTAERQRLDEEVRGELEARWAELEQGTIFRAAHAVKSVRRFPSWLSAASRSRTGRYARPFDLGKQWRVDFGRHRDGWASIVRQLYQLHHGRSAYLSTFLEQEMKSQRALDAKTRPWAGIMHIPHDMPRFFDPSLSNDAVFTHSRWSELEAELIGLFCLSEFHAEHVRSKVRVPVEVLRHPTPYDRPRWSEAGLSKDKRQLLFIGWWLRKPVTFESLRANGWQRCVLPGCDPQKWLELRASQRAASNLTAQNLHPEIELLPRLGNRAYDALLSESVVFLDVWTQSASNLILECMARCTPLILSRHPAAAEYLGADYPLFFDDVEAVEAMLEDPQQLRVAHQYLLDRANSDAAHTAEKFLKGMLEGQIAARLAELGVVRA